MSVPIEPIQLITYDGGYVPSLKDPFAATNDGRMVDGSYNMLVTAQGKPQPFKGLTSLGTGGRVMMAASDGYAMLRDHAGQTAKGNVIAHAGRALWYLGHGAVWFNQDDLGAVASELLYYRLFKNGSYTGVGNTSVAAGLPQPSAPTVVAIAPFGGVEGLNDGTHSFKATRIRGFSGGRSIGSPSTAIISADKQSFHVRFPLPSDGQTHWGLYATHKGYAGFGLHYLYREIPISELTTIDGQDRSIQIAFRDSDLLTHIAPIEDYPPPAGSHLLSIDTVVAVVGAFGDVVTGATAANPGSVIAISLPNFPESFPPHYLLYLPEPPVHVLGRSADGYFLIACRNSIHALQYTGGEPPLTLQTILPDIGIAAPHNIMVADGVLYVVSGKRGLVRLTEFGRPETDWAAPVADKLESWNKANVVLGHDADSETVVLMHGDRALPYNKQEGKWGAEIKLSDFASGNAVSAVTADGSMKCTLDNGGVHTLHTWNSGSGSTWTVRSPFFYGGLAEAEMILRNIRLSGISDNTTFGLTVKIYTNGNRNSPAWTSPFLTVGNQIAHLELQKVFLRRVKSFAVEVTGNSVGTAAGPLRVVVEGQQFPKRRR